jgi:hypothetical protein
MSWREEFDKTFILPSPMFLQGSNFNTYKEFIKQFITNLRKKDEKELIKVFAEDGLVNIEYIESVIKDYYNK